MIMKLLLIMTVTHATEDDENFELTQISHLVLKKHLTNTVYQCPWIYYGWRSGETLQQTDVHFEVENNNWFLIIKFWPTPHLTQMDNPNIIVFNITYCWNNRILSILRKSSPWVVHDTFIFIRDIKGCHFIAGSFAEVIHKS